jgi:hypothetical protein
VELELVAVIDKKEIRWSQQREQIFLNPATLSAKIHAFDPAKDAKEARSSVRERSFWGPS